MVEVDYSFSTQHRYGLIAVLPRSGVHNLWPHAAFNKKLCGSAHAL